MATWIIVTKMWFWEPRCCMSPLWIFFLLVATPSSLKNKLILYFEKLNTWKPIFKIFYSSRFSRNFIVHNCYIIGNNVLPKRWCLIPVEYLFDSTFVKISPSLESSCLVTSFTKTWMTCNMKITMNVFFFVFCFF